jgi:hypothetical protein
MQAINFSNISSDAKSRIDDLSTDIIVATREQQLREAFRFPYAVTDDQHQLMQDMFPTKLVLKDVNRRTKYSQHAILANLNDYCDQDATRVIQSAGLYGPTLSIGDSVKPKINASHNCLLLDNNRDSFRYATASNGSANKHLIENVVQSGLKTNLICMNGCHVCDFKAHTAVAMHSMYDVTPTQLAATFEQHQLYEMYVYIYIPALFYSKHYSGVDKELYGLHISKDKETIVFTMGDFSFPYKHNKETWDFWAKFTQVRYNGMSIVCEHSAVHGPLHILHLVRICDLGSDILMEIPVNPHLQDFVLVPCMKEAMAKNFAVPQSKLRHYHVPKHVVEALTSYCIRQDESYKWSEVATVASGLLRSIKIGSITYYRKWDVDMEDYYNIIMSIFVMGAIQRTDRTKGISTIFAHLKKWQDKSSCLFELRQIFMKIENCFPQTEQTKAKDPKYKKTHDLDFIWGYKYEYLKPSIAGKTVDVHLNITKISPYSHKPIGSTTVYDTDTESSSSSDDDSSDESSDDESFDSTIKTKNKNKNDQQVNPSCKFKKEANVKINDCTRDRNSDIEAADIISYNLDEIFSESDSDESVVERKTPRPSLTSTEIKEKEALVEAVRDRVLNDKIKEVAKKDFIQTLRDRVNNHRDKLKTLVELSKNINVPKPSHRNLLSTPGLELNINSDYEQMAHNVHDLPKNFVPGRHCMMNSVMNASFQKHRLPKVHQFLIDVYRLAHWKMYSSGEEIEWTSMDQVWSYLKDGEYVDNPFAEGLFPLLAEMLKVTIVIHQEDVGQDLEVIHNPTYRKVHIYFTGIANPHGGRVGHFSYLPRGGTKEKYPAIVEAIPIKFVETKCRILDVSASPGYMFENLAQTFKEAKLTYGHYIPGFKTVHTVNEAGNRIKVADREHTFIPYNNFDAFDNSGKFDIIICDAANAVNSEKIIDDWVQKVPHHLNEGGTFICKSFGNIRSIWALSNCFEAADKSKFIGYENSTEHYFIMNNYKPGPIELKEENEKWAEEITVHTCVMDRVKTRRFFEKSFFKEIQIGKNTYLSTPLINGRFNFKALTGYASSGKTKRAAEIYPDAMFIAPTKECSIMHNVKYGVRSYTFHAAIDHVKKAKVVVIDEISMVPMEYVHLIKSIVGKNAEIILVGDVEQVAVCEYNKIKPTSVKDFSVVNNLAFVHQVPIDICKAIRDKLKFSIYTKSIIEKSILKFEGKLEELKKLKIICFNDIISKDLVSKGYNASTITTYQGSRDDAVVFYIDDKAINSQLVNRTEFVYTAMTRARNQLVMYGNTQYIEQFFHINATTVRTYEEISNVFLQQDVHIDEEREETNLVPLAMPIIPNPIIKTSTEVVLDIVQPIVAPINIATTTALFNTTASFPAIESGALSVNLDLLAPPDRIFKVSTLYTSVPLVKHQISSDTATTIKTGISRYLKLTPKLGKKRMKIMSGELMQGFCKGIYGNKESFHKLKTDLLLTPKELQYHYKEYLISLQAKINSNKSALNEIEQEFNEFDEVIQFCNKRQDKYTGEKGWDTSEKVGQGVASLSKRINLIYSVYARAMLHKINNLTNRNSKKQVIFAVFDNNVELNKKYRAYLSKSKKNRNWFCADVSEWDASYNEALADFMMEIMLLCGMPQWLAEYWKLFRKNWKMKILTKHGKAKLEGEHKQFSGNPFTIFENTIGNFALINFLFEFIDEQLSLYKGDDSANNCEDAYLTAEGAEFLGFSKHKLKCHKGKVGDFASFLCTDHGLVPDLVRRTCKIIGANYESKEHLNEAKLSLDDVLCLVDTPFLKNVCAAANSHIYGQEQLTVQQAEVLYDFLNSAKITKWKDLVPTEKHLIRTE